MVGGDIRETFRRLGIFGYLLVGIFIVIVAYFLIFHLAHLAAYSTIIFLIIFVALHLLMHAGHGGHGGGGCMGGGSHEGHREKSSDLEERAR